MANSLYDTGKPLRVVVESPEVHNEITVVNPTILKCPKCGADTPRVPCVWCGHGPQENKTGRVTITPEFEVMKERKQLK